MRERSNASFQGEAPVAVEVDDYRQTVSVGGTQLEEASEYKLTKEKRPADGGAAASTVGSKRPISMMHPFGLADPDRVVFQLFKIDKSGGINWVKVL